MLWMVLLPSALSAAMSKLTPARMSGELMVTPRKLAFRSNPMTVARWGSQRMIWAPMSMSLSTKNSRLSNIFWWIRALPLAWVAVTRTMDNKSGVKPGHGASATVKMEPSMKVSIS